MQLEADDFPRFEGEPKPAFSPTGIHAQHPNSRLMRQSDRAEAYIDQRAERDERGGTEGKHAPAGRELATPWRSIGRCARKQEAREERVHQEERKQDSCEPKPGVSGHCSAVDPGSGVLERAAGNGLFHEGVDPTC
jgi:hypothetical protein